MLGEYQFWSLDYDIRRILIRLSHAFATPNTNIEFFVGLGDMVGTRLRLPPR